MSIEIANIKKSFGRTQVLNDISLDIPSGQMVALLGPSGSGKTTLLRIIAGLEHQTSGQIRFHGTDVSRLHARERKVGFVFQHYALFRHMTVFDNIAFGLSVLPRRERPNAAAIKQKVTQLLEMVQLAHLADRYPAQLSGGQKQRVALARALAVEPQILLLDEPFGALDAQVRKELRRWLRQLHEELKFTSVFVTHDQEEAMAVSDRIAIFYAGHLQQVASPAAIYFSPANRFTAEFMGSCNILETACTAFDAASGMATATAGDREFVFLAGEAEPGAPLHIMLRPDWITPAGPDSVNRFRGTIRERMFLGDSIVYQVEALGRILRVDMPSLNRAEMFAPGDPVELCFAPESPVTVRA